MVPLPNYSKISGHVWFLLKSNRPEPFLALVYSDAFKQGLGCVLMQHGTVIAYASKQLKARIELSNARLEACNGSLLLKDIASLFVWRKM